MYSTLRNAVALSMVGIFIFIDGVNGECANACSGHGRCTNYEMTFSTATALIPEITLPATGNDFGYDTKLTKKDSCTCFSREEDGNTVYAYIGADCSLRTCPYGPSWDSAPEADNVHNMQTECSGRGTCDRKVGQCKCVAPYSGKSCQRTNCPNNCSGRGKCMTVGEVAKLRSENEEYDSLTGFTRSLIQYTSAWDAQRIRGCECDAGFRGSDCSVRECPSGTDPMGGPGGEKGRSCSGRGSCDTENGLCKCFKGFFGTRCENQRSNAI